MPDTLGNNDLTTESVKWPHDKCYIKRARKKIVANEKYTITETTKKKKAQHIKQI